MKENCFERWMYVGDGTDVAIDDYRFKYGLILNLHTNDLVFDYYQHPRSWNPQTSWKKLYFEDYLTQAEQCI